MILIWVLLLLLLYSGGRQGTQLHVQLSTQFKRHGSVTSKLQENMRKTKHSVRFDVFGDFCV
jgi:hypothetical protein